MHTVTDPKLLREALLEHPNEAVCLEPVEGGPRLIYRPGARVPLMLRGRSSSSAVRLEASASSSRPQPTRGLYSSATDEPPKVLRSTNDRTSKPRRR
jgi:hypothetical protein